MAATRAVQSTEALCEARHITHEFPLPGGRPLRVLEDVSLEIRPDEVVALLGPSGCGKSTLMRILAGLLRPSTGEVLYHGAPLAGLNPGAAIVFQSFALYPWLTVRRNVQIVLEARELPAREVRARAAAAIRTVGLAGFEDAYPRELSGGMKQRVGMARALSVDPELLFLDEPFSQVDALTAESLRAEVIDVWAARDRTLSSVLMVSHDIEEVVYMADRIVILAAGPGRVRTVVENRLPRPRDYRSPGALQLVEELHGIITGSELPDVPAAPPAAALPGRFEVIPPASPGEILGLLEYLDARGGADDLFRIANETGRPFGDVIAVVKAAELLDFVDTPKQMVILEPVGQRLLRAAAAERTEIWRHQLLELGLFREIVEALARAEGGDLDADFALEMIALRMPYENFERVFETAAKWAVAGDLFEYDDDAGVLRVPRPEGP
jgi:NitT/TauT family transport system ATP-binding protein